MRQQEKWQEIIAPLLKNTPYELVGVECVGGGKHTTVRIFIDKPGGITLDDIVKLTPSINTVLEVEQPLKGRPYVLEVSSPGIERPLFLPQHFQQQVGQKVMIKIGHSFENRQNFKGILLEANDESLTIEQEGRTFSFTYMEIDKAKVIPTIVIGSSIPLSKNDREKRGQK